MKSILKSAAVLCCMATVAFAACQKEPVFLADVKLPAEATGNEMLVEGYAHDFTFDIKTEGEWKVESDRRFLRVSPKEGTGNATVTVSVEANQSDDRKMGTLSVTFPGHEDQNKVLIIEQKFAGDYGANAADVIATSNKIYAVGFSYDCTGEYASPNSVMKEVFDTEALMADKVLAVNAAQISLTTSTVTGSTVNELTNNLAVKANVEGGFGKFKSEANGSFDMDVVKNTNYEFASNYFDLAVRRASLNKGLESLKDDYMTDDAWNDINGVPVKNKRGIKKVAYPSTPEGFRRLVQDYGTHVVVEAGLGGRVRYSMWMDISDVNTTYDIKAFAKASYDGVVKTGGSVDEKFKNTYKAHKDNISVQINVLGGDENLGKVLRSKEGFTNANMDEWIKSVTADNMALVSFGDKSLVPIYELVERNATEEDNGFDGNKRYEALKEYIEHGCSGDFSSYECGTVTKIKVPSFADKQNGGTLVQDVMLGGQWVGQVCEEFLPLIDKNKRVTVVYPVLNNKVRYNMGFFIGDADHKPARVSWEGDQYRIVEYDGLNFGSVDSLCMRGASVTPKAADGTDVRQGTLQDECLDDYGWNGSDNVPYKYPLVKIFNQIWTRTGYKYNVVAWGSNFSQKINNLWHVYINNVGINQCTGGSFDQPYPNGWRVPVQSDYEAMMKKVEGKDLLQGGASGFDVVFAGWYAFPSGKNAREWVSSQTEMYLGVSRGEPNNKPHRYFRITNQGQVSYGELYAEAHVVRLIKK